jgi:phosphoglycolate phosphatase-like HAD superfamily hydrolase
MVDSDEEAAWTMVNKISNLIERAEAAEAERHELKNKLAVQQNWQTLYEREKAEVARLREALRLIASGGCAIPSMKCIPGMSCSACIARDALAAPTKEDA